MLVLSRKKGECVRIGPSIEVKVLELRGGRVKLGFFAPPDVAIHRDEIQDAYPHGPPALWSAYLAVAEPCTF